MLSILITILITFFGCSLFGYVVHKSLHQKWTGRLNKSHMTHHLKMYPISDYTSDIYRDAGKDDSTKLFAIPAIPVVATPIILGITGFLSLSLIITSLIVMGIIGFLNVYIHDAFHIRNHWMNKIPAFKSLFIRWNELHYQHHENMQANFGIFDFTFDKILGTFQKK